MRLLCVCVPGATHVANLLPVARALTAAGHEVLFATGRDCRAQVEEAGFTFLDAGPSRDDAGAELARRYPELPEVSGEEHQAFQVRQLWARIYPPGMLAALQRPAGEWAPDVIIYDLATFAGPLLAAILGCPAVSHSFGPAFPFRLMRGVEAALDPLWREHGLSVPPAAGTVSGPRIETWPAPLQLPDGSVARESWQVRVADVAAEAPEVPDYLSDRGERPLVHVTLGTIFNDPGVLRQVIGALENEPYDVHVTLGEQDGENEQYILPSGVRVSRWVRHEEVLPHCDAVVCHAGSGTVLGALAHGVPLVLLPQAADHFRTAAGCLRAGVGVRLLPGEVSAEALRTATRSALRSGSIRAAAAKLREHIACLPPPATVVPAVEDLVAGSG